MYVNFYYFLSNKKIILINKIIDHNMINETFYDIKYFDLYIFSDFLKYIFNYY